MIKDDKELNDVVCTAYRMGCEQTREVYQKRVEKLEAALRKIMNLGQSAVPDHWEARCLARDTARKALEAKDD